MLHLLFFWAMSRSGSSKAHDNHGSKYSPEYRETVRDCLSGMYYLDGRRVYRALQKVRELKRENGIYKPLLFDTKQGE
jgi:hypothetical protein